MTTIVDFLINTIGSPNSTEQVYFYYILGGIILLIFIDGIISFLLGGISSLTMRGR